VQAQTGLVSKIISAVWLHAARPVGSSAAASVNRCWAPRLKLSDLQLLWLGIVYRERSGVLPAASTVRAIPSARSEASGEDIGTSSWPMVGSALGRPR
jgi:hypothetical protein